MPGWSHRVCERCFFDGYVPLDPNVTDRVIPGVRDGQYVIPVQVKDEDPGRCCSCGGVTITGIYVRENPNNLRCLGIHSGEPLDLHWEGLHE